MNQLIDQMTQTITDSGLGHMLGALVVGTVMIAAYSAFNWVSNRFIS